MASLGDRKWLYAVTATGLITWHGWPHHVTVDRMRASEQGHEERSDRLRGRYSTPRGAAKGLSTPPVVDRATVRMGRTPTPSQFQQRARGRTDVVATPISGL